jgi:hypothetical protein
MHTGGLRPFADIHLKIPWQKVRGSTVRGIFSAFVDTGSPFTLISENDSIKLRMQTKGKPRQIPLAGTLFNMFEIDDVILNALCDDKKTLCDISMPSIGVIRPISNVPRSTEMSKALPSIIGVDLLKHHKLAFYFDAYHQISYLEKV